MDDSKSLVQQADKIRASGILGQSRLLRLFDFLVESSAAGAAPKEIVIAMEVFQKPAAFDGTLDSSVRVYVHNLRRKLEEFYLGPGRHEAVRLTLPKGEYRLVAVPAELATIDDVSPAGPRAHRGPRIIAAFALGLLVCLLAAGLLLQHRSETPWDSIRNSPVWARVLDNGKPTVIVMGDYYIFGDTQQTRDVQQLIRNFNINSKDDLRRYLQANPTLTERYMNVELGYLPTSSAFALAGIMPLLVRSPKGRLPVALVSSLDPGAIKSANIVYIGLLSGLGSLQKLAFAASRFQLGDSFDELIDRKTRHHYVSGAVRYAGEAKHFGNDIGYHDYGFFSTFAGLAGNRIVIIAGTQDEGLRQMADALSDNTKLNELNSHASGAPDFEALVEVLGMDSLNLSGKILITSSLNPVNIWTAR